MTDIENPDWWMVWGYSRAGKGEHLALYLRSAVVGTFFFFKYCEIIIFDLSYDRTYIGTIFSFLKLISCYFYLVCFLSLNVYSFFCANFELSSLQILLCSLECWLSSFMIWQIPCLGFTCFIHSLIIVKIHTLYFNWRTTFIFFRRATQQKL